MKKFAVKVLFLLVLWAGVTKFITLEKKFTITEGAEVLVPYQIASSHLGIEQDSLRNKNEFWQVYKMDRSYVQPDAFVTIHLQKKVGNDTLYLPLYVDELRDALHKATNSNKIKIK